MVHRRRMWEFVVVSSSLRLPLLLRGSLEWFGHRVPRDPPLRYVTLPFVLGLIFLSAFIRFFFHLLYLLLFLLFLMLFDAGRWGWLASW